MTLKILPVVPIVLVLLGGSLTFAADKAADKTAGGPAKTSQETQYGSVEERRIMESLQGASSSPFARESEELENKKKELKRLESEVDKKIDQLNQLRLGIEKQQAEKKAAETNRAQELAKVYEKMSAEKAASILGTIDQELAIAILAKMKTKSAAKILNSMEREKAAKLTTEFSIQDR
jgi:flagellar motility protein MotE (MotC chaperone)